LTSFFESEAKKNRKSGSFSLDHSIRSKPGLTLFDKKASGLALLCGSIPGWRHPDELPLRRVKKHYGN
jgi:hypothetical protein